jgi:hypothetical protein
MAGKRKIILNPGDLYSHLEFMHEKFIIGNTTGYKVRVAVCKCDCGKIVTVNVTDLIAGKKKSCGCKNVKSIPPLCITHGLSNTRIYGIWKQMKVRCKDMSGDNFRYYGSRGISVCLEWQNSFQSFYNWSIANGYNDNLTLDRVENDKGYCPGNCRWTTMLVQSNNTRSNVLFEYKGVSKTLTEWARLFDFNRHTIYKRVVRMGWSISDALTVPLSERHSLNSNQHSNKRLSK